MSCRSFNLVKASETSDRGRCELIDTNNWFPGRFVASSQISDFYASTDYLDASYFQLIPAVVLGSNDPAVSVSNLWTRLV
jgi:hypothetical protein